MSVTQKEIVEALLYPNDTALNASLKNRALANRIESFKRLDWSMIEVER